MPPAEDRPAGHEPRGHYAEAAAVAVVYFAAQSGPLPLLRGISVPILMLNKGSASVKVAPGARGTGASATANPPPARHEYGIGRCMMLESADTLTPVHKGARSSTA